MKLKSVGLISLLAISCASISHAKTARQENLPAFLKGIKHKNQTMRHGYMRWASKRPYTPLLDSNASKRGHAIYEKHCVECHGISGEGNGPSAKIIGLKPANLKKVAKDLSNHYLAFQIETGSPTMPSWEDVLTESDLWDLTHYLHDLSLKN